MDRTEALEAHVAHLGKTVDELNEVVAAQAAQIERLGAQVAYLMGRAREAEGGGGVILGDERPPHY